jgi:SSS family solute:Na+ symporter
VTIAVSMMTAPKREADLKGLVYGLTELPSDAAEPWYRRPLVLASIVGVCLIALNAYFW